MKRLLVIIPLALVFVLTLGLGSKNSGLVQFNYLLAQGEFPLALLIGLFFAAGFLLGWLVFGLLYLRMKFQLRALHRTIRKQSQALELAQLPSKD